MMSRIFFWKVDPKKLVPMRPEEIEDSLKWRDCAQVDAMPEQWCFVGFTAQSHITAGRKLTPVRGGLWRREGRLL